MIGKPPRIAQWFFSRSVRSEDREILLGDFQEFFSEISVKKGRRYALLWYWKQIFRSFPRILAHTLWAPFVLLRNYLLVSVRNFRKSKLNFLINVSGLAVGMACCMLILVFIMDELSFDRFQKNGDRIFRVVCEELQRGAWETGAGTPEPLGAALVEEFPEVVRAVRIYHPSWVTKWAVSHEGRSFYEEDVYFTDSSFLEVFTFPLIKGDPETALKGPRTAVITQAASEKYFGDRSPLGEILTIDGRIEVRITGLAGDIPHNSHLFFSLLVSFDAMPDKWVLNNWRTLNMYTYLLLNQPHSPEAFESRLGLVIKKNFGPVSDFRFIFQPLLDIHLHSRRFGFDLARHKSDIAYVTIFSLIAVFILLLACVNFMNLTTARSMKRAKEVGLRKVIGARKSQLRKQFLGESVLSALAAFAAALFLAFGFLPFLSRLTERKLSLTQHNLPLELLLLFMGAILVGLFSGSYPAMFLSRFRPVDVLKGDFGSGRKSVFVRRILVLFQFSISVFLIIGTAVIFKQNRFCRKTNLGFDKEQVVVVPLWDSRSKAGFDSFKDKLREDPLIKGVAGASEIPGGSIGTRGMLPENNTWAPQNSIFVDENFIQVMGLEIVEGRNFSREIASDEDDAYMVNEAAVRAFGWEKAVGKRLFWRGDRNKKGQVVGVVKDFHYASFHQKIEPLVLMMNTRWASYALVRIQMDKISESLASIRKTWKTLHPDHPLEYSFLDSRFEELYRSEERMGKIFEFFTLIALFISCLGLFGLAAQLVEHKAKEAGIRKVLGASPEGIAFLFSREFLKWVLLANIFAWPAAYWAMHRWLQNFVYRTSLGWEIFVASSVLAVVVAFLTVGWQSFRAARTDPARSLRYE
ncbi:MAG: ABC transporter permease [Candidatus Aminicenantes bacterium]|nr:ABC transporter permease [Candidatus Aminicenantes bacterium]